MLENIHGADAATRPKRNRWIWLSAAGAALAFLAIVWIVIRHAGPILKGRVEETLSTRFDSRVELDKLDVSFLRGLEVSGERLRIYPPDDVVAAGANQPLISIAHFQFHSGILGLFIKPMHLRAVTVRGLQINIPPREQREQVHRKKSPHTRKIKIVVDEVVCDDSRLIIATSNPKKEPKNFALSHIVLRDVGPQAPWSYNAVLTNAVPRGEIHSIGSFGPWQTESPGESSVRGHYTFDHADLNTIKGIGGMLSSTGDFQGKLDRIEIDGTAETPDFSLDTANHPLALHTQFHAIVDGISGDTYLQSVHAKLKNSSFTTSGAVINIRGVGHQIDLDLAVASAQLQDFLDLAVNTSPAVMQGLISTRTKLQIRPGKESVTKRLSFAGRFTLEGIHFTSSKVQDKVDMLSLRARGEPKKAKPGAADVNSRMNGKFQMANGIIRFSELHYMLPGARVQLTGDYSLDGEQFDFHGKVLTEAALSQMVSSPIASLLLKVIAPFFRNKGGGASIPVSISGTRSEPKFGLDAIGHHKS